MCPLYLPDRLRQIINATDFLRRNHSGLRRTKGSNARSSGSKRSPARYSRGESIPTLATGIVLGAHTFHSLSVKEGGNRTKHDCLPLWLWQGSFF